MRPAVSRSKVPRLNSSVSVARWLSGGRQTNRWLPKDEKRRSNDSGSGWLPVVGLGVLVPDIKNDPFSNRLRSWGSGACGTYHFSRGCEYRSSQ